MLSSSAVKDTAGQWALVNRSNKSEFVGVLVPEVGIEPTLTVK